MDSQERAMLFKDFMTSRFAPALADLLAEDTRGLRDSICRADDDGPKTMKLRGKWLYSSTLFERIVNEAKNAPDPNQTGQGTKKEG